MDKQKFIDYYVNLLIRHYHDKLKAKETIAWAVNKKAELYDLALQLMIAFDIDSAVGKQLDIIGKYVNLPRIFDDGSVLLDNDYRFFIRWKIISNLNMNNMKSLRDALNNIFNGGITLINNMDMSISYWIKYPTSDEIVALLQQNKNLLPAPAGVDVNYIIDNKTNKLFGFSFLVKDKVISYNDIAGFSEVNNDSAINFIDGDFLDLDSIIY
jgi:hypothetical protein